MARFCWQLAAALSAYAGRLEEHAVRLVGVSAGKPRQAKLFQQESGFRGELYVEPEADQSKLYAAYRAFRLPRSTTLAGWEAMGMAGEDWESQKASGALEDRELVDERAAAAAAEAWDDGGLLREDRPFFGAFSPGR